MKRILIAVPSVLVVVIALLLIGPSFVDWSAYKTQAQEQINKATGFEVDMKGDLQLAILPSPRVLIEDMSIRAPEGSSAENLVSLKRLSVNLALMPLLGGEIVVDSVKMIEPQIDLEILKSGKPNWISPKIEEGLAEKKEAPDTENPAENKLAQAISLQKVHIEGGRFSYIDQAKKGNKTEIGDIDATLQAETLEGPYKLEGSFAYGGNNIELTGSAGRYSADTKSIVPMLKVVIMPLDVVVKYSGVLSLDGKVELQGETGFSLTSVEKTFSAFGAKNLKDFDVPLEGKGLLTASEAGIDYKDLTLDLAGNKYAGSLSAKLAPMNIKADLKAAAPPKFAVWLPQTLKADVNLTTSGQKTSLSNSIIKLDDTALTVTGSYEGGPRPKADLTLVSKAVDLDAWSSRLGKDGAKSAQQAQGGATSKADAKALGQSLMLPMDLDFDFDIGNLKAQGRSVDGLRAVGELRKNSLSLEKLSVQNVSGAAFSLKGAVQNLKDLSGIDMSFSGTTQDLRKAVSAFGGKAETVPDLGKVEALAEVKGSAQSLDTTANIKALGGELITQGVLANPLQAVQIDKLTVQVKHGDLAQALQVLTPGTARNEALAGPVDLYAEVSRAGTVYTLNDFAGKLAGTAVEGTLEVDTGGAKPQAKGGLKIGDLAIDAPVKKPSGSGGGSSAGASGGNADMRWSREAINTAWMHSANADIDVVAKSITYGKWKLVNPVLKAKLQDGALDVSQLDAQVFGGTLAMNANVKSSQNPREPVHVRLASQLRDVSIEQLALALSGGKAVQGKGQVSMDSEFSASGISPAALVYDMGGKGSLTGKDLVMEGYDLANFAAAMSDETKIGHNAEQIWAGTQKGGTTRFDTMDGQFTASEGVINVSKLDLESEKLSVAAKGTINLPRWWIDMPAQITMKPPYEIPPYTIPIQGPLDNPKAVTSNIMGDFVMRKLERKLIKEIGAEGELGDLLGKVLNVPKQPAPQNAPVPAPVAPAPVPAAPAPVPVPEQVVPSGGEEIAPVPQPEQPYEPASEPQAQPEPAPQQEQQPVSEEEKIIRGVIDLLGQ